jgi:hypothetical protein
MAWIPKLEGITYAGSGPGPKPQGPGVPVPGPGGSEYGGEWEKPVTIPNIVSMIQAQGLPLTPQNINRTRTAVSNGVTLPRPPIPPQPGPDRTVEGYQPHFSDGGGDNNTSALPPKRMGPYPMPNDGGTPRPPDVSGDPVTQGSPRGPSPQAVGLPEPSGPPQAFPQLGRDILNLRPLLQLLTTPLSQNTALSPTLQENLGVPVEPPIIQQPQIAGPPKQLALPAPAGQPALPAPPRPLALPAPAPQSQPALPAPNMLPQGPGFSPEYPRSPVEAAIDKAVPADEAPAPRAKTRAARGRRR